MFGLLFVFLLSKGKIPIGIKHVIAIAKPQTLMGPDITYSNINYSLFVLVVVSIDVIIANGIGRDQQVYCIDNSNGELIDVVIRWCTLTVNQRTGPCSVLSVK